MEVSGVHRHAHMCLSFFIQGRQMKSVAEQRRFAFDKIFGD